MKHKSGIKRRDFISSVAIIGVGSTASKFIGLSTQEYISKKEDKSKILNFNPKMHYRRLGKTGLILSEVGLGGHWRAPWRVRSEDWRWSKFFDDEIPVIPDKVLSNRTEVVSLAIDLGMNYLDLTGLAECMVFGAALKGRREKMIIAADDYLQSIRHDELINVKSQIHNVEKCLQCIGTDYLDVWKSQAKLDGSNTDADLEVLIETFQKLHKAGKVRYLGISSHNRNFIQHVIENFPQFDMVTFPITAKTRNMNEPPTRNNIEEVEIKNIKDPVFNKSVFTSALKHNVGVIAIKPFFGGSLFKSHGQVKTGVGNKQDHDLARLTLQAILDLNDAITSVIPGQSTIYETENAALASYTRPFGQMEADRDWLKKITDDKWAALSQEYSWLRDWEII